MLRKFLLKKLFFSLLLGGYFVSFAFLSPSNAYASKDQDDESDIYEELKVFTDVL